MEDVTKTIFKWRNAEFNSGFFFPLNNYKRTANPISFNDNRCD